MFKISEYKNLYNVINIAFLSVRIYLLYYLLGEVSKENYKYLYKEDDTYEKALKVFEGLKKQDQDAIFTIIWYSIGTISLYNYEMFKENIAFIEKIKKLNDKIQMDISLEDALKIIDIKLDCESLDKILNSINKFKENLTKEKNNYVTRT